MANSDKNILITPNVSAATGTYPSIKFTGANNTPTTMRVLDDGTLSFEATAGQLFSISDGLSGSIFSVNDISGIPSIEILDTGLVKLNQYGGSTVINGSAAIQNSSSVNAKLSVYTGTATTPGLIIKGAASQSANLQEWQDSTGAVKAKIGADGAFTIGASSGYSYFDTYGNLYIRGAGYYTANVNIKPDAASTIGMVIRGVSGQTANLQEWQNSAGTVLVSIISGGSLRGWSGIRADNVNDTNQNALFVNNSAASAVATVIRGAASQTANLQEWQNSSGTVLGRVDNYGALYLSETVQIGPGTSDQRIAGGGLTIIHRGATSAITFGIKAIASQTGNLTEWQDSNGNVLSRVNSGGFVDAIGYRQLSGNANSFGLYGSTIAGTVTSFGSGANPSIIPVVVRGAASQTANLQEWQNSAGTVLSSINASGQLELNGKDVEIMNIMGAY